MEKYRVLVILHPSNGEIEFSKTTISNGDFRFNFWVIFHDCLEGVLNPLYVYIQILLFDGVGKFII